MSAVETLIVPRSSDLGGGLHVRRALPSAQRRTVGPFVFLDNMGPALFEPGTGVDVRPHPHIGLSTVTYLYEGAMMHRDGAGHTQEIRPGEVNWMTAGRGIVHSERTPGAQRGAGHCLSGLQLWVGLPSQHEETDPGFVHYGLDAQPIIEGEGVRAQVVAGSLFGKTSKVQTLSPLFFGDIVLQAGASVVLPAEHEERAAYLSSGTVEVDGQAYEPGQLLVFAAGLSVTVRAVDAARIAVLGGEPLDGPRFVWWNFVSSRKDRIEQAKQDWQRDRFNQTVPGDETEYIPLPPPRA
ncbi:pirin family protein [Bordetella petrii]|uniref:pirin family protein n=1 Tax=Bordetella petrii TaxID=94624 RepID=UPI001E45D525|nr:pirin family protein [Bordetella petrii]MCD0503486.1 pirin family protein [Bordetella petrii]